MRSSIVARVWQALPLMFKRARSDTPAGTTCRSWCIANNICVTALQLTLVKLIAVNIGHDVICA
jgi:hypothetical protein